MGQTGYENDRRSKANAEAAGRCSHKLDGCRGLCCNCEKCIAAKGGRDICANCAAALKKTTFAR